MNRQKDAKCQNLIKESLNICQICTKKSHPKIVPNNSHKKYHKRYQPIQYINKKQHVF